MRTSLWSICVFLQRPEKFTGERNGDNLVRFSMQFITTTVTELWQGELILHPFSDQTFQICQLFCQPSINNTICIFIVNSILLSFSKLHAGFLFCCSKMNWSEFCSFEFLAFEKFWPADVSFNPSLLIHSLFLWFQTTSVHTLEGVSFCSASYSLFLSRQCVHWDRERVLVRTRLAYHLLLWYWR